MEKKKEDRSNFIIGLIVVCLLCIWPISCISRYVNKVLDEQAAYTLMGPGERKLYDMKYQAEQEKIARERAYQRLHKK